jgi:fatty-acyl-CoA synthase
VTPIRPAERLRLPVHNGHSLLAGLRRAHAQPVLTLGETALTGAEVLDATARYITVLRHHGIDSGAPLGILALNRPEVLFTIAAGQLRGHRRTALHPLGGVDDHAHILDDAGITTLILDPHPAFVARVRELLDRVPSLTKVLVLGPVPAELARVGVDLTAEAAALRRVDPVTVAELPPDHVVSVTYTGGTTGRPKGVIGTALGMTTMTQIMLAEWEWPRRPRFLLCTPLSHAGAAFFLPTILRGGRLVVLPRFDAGAVLAAIEEHRISATMLVPSMLYALLDHPDFPRRDLSSLEVVYYGASAIDPGRLRQAIDRMGPIFAQYFGQSEAPMAISYLARDEHDEDRLTSCGRPSAMLRTALLGPAGAPVARGEAGEICVSGPLLALGYRNLPEVTAQTFRDGWLYTGDLAREDEDGFLHIVGRSKDMIVTGGFNVFAREVEDVIAADPQVAAVTVVGVPDPAWGEAVTALVVPATSAAQDRSARDELAARLVATVRERKGPVHAPKHVLFVDAIPLTALGKPDKVASRATAAAILGVSS